MWPSLNGRALRCGLNLKTMECEDMLDVVHTYYEEDNTPLFEGHSKLRSDVRSAIWEHIYKKPYPFPYDDPDAPKDLSQIDSDMMDMPVDPSDLPTKEYIPPTDPSELGDILDAPLGG